MCLSNWLTEKWIGGGWESRRAYYLRWNTLSGAYVMAKLVVVSIFLVHSDGSRHVSEVGYDMPKCWNLGGELKSEIAALLQILYQSEYDIMCS